MFADMAPKLVIRKVHLKRCRISSGQRSARGLMVHVKGCVHATFSGPVRWGLVADGEAMAKVDIVVAGSPMS